MVDATGEPAPPAADRRPAGPLLGLLAGLGAGLLVAAGWYAASVGTKSQLLYLMVAIGLAVGFATTAVAARGGALIAAVAVIVTFVCCLAGYYVVSRLSLIRRGYVRLPDEGPISSVPSFTLVRDVLRVSLRGTIGPFFWLAAGLVAAGVLGWRGLDAGGRRVDH